jgi:uncharacterized membrane protein
MKTSSLNREIIIWIIIIIPIAYLGLSWGQLPNRIPIHFNVAGKANGWGSKSALVGIVFGMTVVMNLLLLFIPKFDPKGKIEHMGRKYFQMRLFIVLFLAALATFVVYHAQTREALNPSVMLMVIGGMFVVLGNYFPALKPNYFIGLRTPWTLESELVWKKTHRLAGWFWVIGGILIIVTSLLPYDTWRMYIFEGTIFSITLIPAIYSFVIRNEGKQADTQ